MKPKSLFAISLIDVSQWDKASWRGVAFLMSLNPEDIPGLGILFEAAEEGKKIFEDWRSRLGEHDEYEELRIAFIEGDIPGKDPGYSVHLRPNPERVIQRARDEGHDIDVDYFVMASRFHRMNISATPGPRLADFRAAFEKHGQYFFVPLFGSPTSPSSMQPDLDLSIVKGEVLFRTFDDILAYGQQDPDYAVLH